MNDEDPNFDSNEVREIFTNRPIVGAGTTNHVSAAAASRTTTSSSSSNIVPSLPSIRMSDMIPSQSAASGFTIPFPFISATTTTNSRMKDTPATTPTAATGLSLLRDKSLTPTIPPDSTAVAHHGIPAIPTTNVAPLPYASITTFGVGGAGGSSSGGNTTPGTILVAPQLASQMATTTTSLSGTTEQEVTLYNSKDHPIGLYDVLSSSSKRKHAFLARPGNKNYILVTQEHSTFLFNSWSPLRLQQQQEPIETMVSSSSAFSIEEYVNTAIGITQAIKLRFGGRFLQIYESDNEIRNDKSIMYYTIRNDDDVLEKTRTNIRNVIDRLIRENKINYQQYINQIQQQQLLFQQRQLEQQQYALKQQQEQLDKLIRKHSKKKKLSTFSSSSSASTPSGSPERSQPQQMQQDEQQKSTLQIVPMLEPKQYFQKMTKERATTIVESKTGNSRTTKSSGREKNEKKKKMNDQIKSSLAPSSIQLNEKLPLGMPMIVTRGPTISHLPPTHQIAAATASVSVGTAEPTVTTAMAPGGSMIPMMLTSPTSPATTATPQSLSLPTFQQHPFYHHPQQYGGVVLTTLPVPTTTVLPSLRQGTPKKTKRARKKGITVVSKAPVLIARKPSPPPPLAPMALPSVPTENTIPARPNLNATKNEYKYKTTGRSDITQPDFHPNRSQKRHRRWSNVSDHQQGLRRYDDLRQNQHHLVEKQQEEQRHCHQQQGQQRQQQQSIPAQTTTFTMTASAAQIKEALPPNASAVIHIFDRRVNLDNHPSDASMYSLLRSWVQDDPYGFHNRNANHACLVELEQMMDDEEAMQLQQYDQLREKLATPTTTLEDVGPKIVFPTSVSSLGNVDSERTTIEKKPSRFVDANSPEPEEANESPHKSSTSSLQPTSADMTTDATISSNSIDQLKKEMIERAKKIKRQNLKEFLRKDEVAMKTLRNRGIHGLRL